MKKWNMIIDVKKCEDCNNCFLSCKDEYVGNEFPGYSSEQPRHGHRWIDIMRKERGQHPLIDVAYLPVPCMHCDNAPCIKAAKEGAVYKRSDGIVIIDPEKAAGQRNILESCPYGAVWWNDDLDIPQKCTFCAYLLDNDWKEPRCVQACPTSAMQVVRVEDEEMNQIVESENLEVLNPEYNTRPRVYYRNLYRFNRCFIRGSTAFERDGAIDCAAGAEVSLAKDSREIDKTLTDNFGDFKFDNLEENGGEYQVEISLEGYEKKDIKVNLKDSVSIGTIMLG
ncbi:4Fe-4S dicluster domain-containing protein [Thermodesulfobacteriota bacterium]